MNREDLDRRAIQNFQRGLDALRRPVVTPARNPMLALAAEYMAATFLSNILRRYSDEFVTESPIEEAFLSALLCYGYEQTGHDVMLRRCWNNGRHKFIGEAGGEEGPQALEICQQHHLGQYRVDFLVTGHGPISTPQGIGTAPYTQVVVECDGHDFHERTKEQARRDRQRDRFLQMAGFKIFRFTGSEIFNDPFACAKEAYAAAFTPPPETEP